MLSWAIYLAVFFVVISYAIHLLKQKQNSEPKTERAKSASDSSSEDDGHH